MRTIEATAVVGPDRKIEVQLPSDVSVVRIASWSSSTNLRHRCHPLGRYGLLLTRSG